MKTFDPLTPIVNAGATLGDGDGDGEAVDAAWARIVQRIRPRELTRR